MSEDENPTRPGTYKTIGARLQTPIHAQLSTIAGIDDLSLQVLLVRGAKLLIEAKQAAPDFKDRVTAELKKIEQEAAERRGAIESLFGSNTQADDTPADANGTAPEAEAADGNETADAASTPDVEADKATAPAKKTAARSSTPKS